MKTVIKRIDETTLEEFAEANDLTMTVNERRLPKGDPARFYASFNGIEVKDGPVLCSTYGNGSTPEEAIRAYAPEISMKTLVLDAMRPTRKTIESPRLT
jgi:hypothetical protein